MALFEARAAEALVLASRHAIGLLHTLRGLRVRSPVLSFIFVKIQVLNGMFVWAIHRSRMMLGITSTKLRTNMNVMKNDAGLLRYQPNGHR